MRRYFVLLMIAVVAGATFSTVAFAGETAKVTTESKKETQVVFATAEQNCPIHPEPCTVFDPWEQAAKAMDIVVAQENERIAAEKAEQERQQLLAQQSVATVPAQPFDLPAECDGKVIPAYIIMRESKCNYGVVNFNGCGGYNCYGMYQIDGRHWSSWGSTPGVCNDLNWEIPTDQDECASRLSSGGSNLRPWGG